MTSLRSNEGGSGSVDAAEKRNHRMDDVRGGFVLKAKSDEPPARRNSLVEKTRKGLLSVRQWKLILFIRLNILKFYGCFTGIKIEKATEYG